jgi:hypothetical protein
MPSERSDQRYPSRHALVTGLGLPFTFLASVTLFGVMSELIDIDELRKLTPAERQRLIRDLVELERESTAQPGSGWKWDALLVVIIGSCIILAAWIGYLIVTLPAFYHTGSWRGAWVGFDAALLCAFAAAGWAAWRRRQLLIIVLAVLATLLLCDAWFDVVLDVKTPGLWESVASALLIELPLAVIAIATARRLLRLTIGQVMRYEGLSGPVPPLWKIPLLGPASGTPIDRLIAARAAHKADGIAAADPPDR